MAARTAFPVLLCRLPSCLIGVPLEHVIETMRPLPVEPLSAGAPVFVTGLSVIRGAPVPVVDTSRLLGGQEIRAGRFVTVKTGRRIVALACQDVVGVRTLERESLQELPPLLREAETTAIAAIGALDTDLLAVLQSACILPEGLPNDGGAGTASL